MYATDFNWQESHLTKLSSYFQTAHYGCHLNLPYREHIAYACHMFSQTPSLHLYTEINPLSRYQCILVKVAYYTMSVSFSAFVRLPQASMLRGNKGGEHNSRTFTLSKTYTKSILYLRPHRSLDSSSSLSACKYTDVCSTRKRGFG